MVNYSEIKRLPLGSHNGFAARCTKHWIALASAMIRNETMKDGYVGGTKRRLRDEWIIQPGTHPALIADAEVEAILERLTHGRCLTIAHNGSLVEGVLFTPEGVAWHGNFIALARRT